MTLLEMTQSILASLGSDQVNSISDTVESVQVAEILKQTYYNMLGRYDLPEHNQLVQLVASTDPTQPTLMTLPAGVSRIEWVKYFDSNPKDSTQQDQFGSFSHGLNTDLVLSNPPWSTTSTTSNSLALGSHTFTVGVGLTILTGQPAFCFPGALPSGANSMSGTVTSYNNITGQLILNITVINGSGGPFTQWIITNNAGTVFGPGYKDVPLIPIDYFIDMVSMFDPSEANVGVFNLTIQDNATGVNQLFEIKFKNDHQPRYCAILSNNFVLFDSYDNTQDNTLQSSKSMTMAWSVPGWLMVDNFIPNIDEQHFPLMLNDAKSLAFVELKQMPHQKAEDEVARQLVSLQKWKAISGKPTYFEELPSFGRRGGSLSGYGLHGNWI